MQDVLLPMHPVGLAPYPLSVDAGRSEAAAVALLVFPEDFARPAPESPAPAEPVVPAFTEADLAAAHATGHKAGEQAGRAAAAEEQRARVAELLAVIAERLDGARDAAVQAADSCAEALARLLLDALGTAFPVLRARHGEAELRRMVATIAPTVMRETQVTLHVHPTLAAAAADELAALPLHRGAAPRVETSEEIAVGDAVILWGDGRAVRDSTTAWQEIAEVLRPLGLLPDAVVTE